MCETDVRCLLEFSQNTTLMPLGDPEVEIIDVELFLNAFVYNCVDNTRTSLFEVYEVQAIGTSACELGKHQFR